MSFTLLIWVLLFLIYISDKNNKINQWCVITGIIFSLGTLKEYLYFEIVPSIAGRFGTIIPMSLITSIYYVITAILYYLAMPSSVLFALYFTAYPARNPKPFKFLRISVFFPAAIIFFAFRPVMISCYQYNSNTFWYTAAAYNLFFGIAATALMVRAVLAEKVPAQRRQKVSVCLVVLPPVWYWMAAVFVVRSLKITELNNIWKDNSIIVGLVIIFYISAAFKEGIMGMRLRGENYQWDSDMQTISKGAQYTSHILKNEVTKIEWCSSNLSKKYADSPPEELAIIQRSAQHLKQFVNKTQLYSNNIILNREDVLVHSIIDASILSTNDYVGPEIAFHVNCSEHAYMKCDKEHVLEVLNNLISNSADAMNKNGTITITYTFNAQKHQHVLSVSDEGQGIPRQNMYRLFEPYFTTKKTNAHFGLGLTYCANVMKKHKGYIDIKSEVGKGTTFDLFFPSSL